MASIPPELLEQQDIRPSTPPAADEPSGPYEQAHDSAPPEHSQRDEPREDDVEPAPTAK